MAVESLHFFATRIHTRHNIVREYRIGGSEDRIDGDLSK